MVPCRLLTRRLLQRIGNLNHKTLDTVEVIREGQILRVREVEVVLRERVGITGLEQVRAPVVGRVLGVLVVRDIDGENILVVVEGEV